MQETNPTRLPSELTQNFSRGTLLKSSAAGAIRFPLKAPGTNTFLRGISQLVSNVEFASYQRISRRAIAKTIFERPKVTKDDPEVLIQQHIQPVSESDHQGNATLKRNGQLVWPIHAYHETSGENIREVARVFGITMDEAKAAIAHGERNQRVMWVMQGG